MLWKLVFWSSEGLFVGLREPFTHLIEHGTPEKQGQFHRSQQTVKKSEASICKLDFYYDPLSVKANGNAE